MGEGNIGHLWFLQELIKLYLIFPIIKVVKDKNDAVYNYFVKLLNNYFIYYYIRL